MATATPHLFAKNFNSLAAKAENLTTDALKIALGSAFTPGTLQATAQTAGDISTAFTELTTGGGYTAGGLALTSLALASTAANSWATVAAITTAYTVGAIVRPTAGNGYLYQAVVGGTSGGAAPTWPTVVGTTVVDGTVTWLNIGSAVTTLTCAAPSWTSVTTGITASYALIYDSTTGTFPAPLTGGTADVIAYYDFGGSQSATNGGLFTIGSGTQTLLAIGSN